MSQRKDSYRAALRREQDVSAPRSTKVARLKSRYIRVTVELDPDLRGDLTRWMVRPVSSVVLAGATVLRTLAATAGWVARPGDQAASVPREVPDSGR
ncbi:hypothetical protein [Streptomyces sp. GS7]|uniref:hypothetical protein n=1 Tax=Streptomyces sp. GS7 TaxID=2692234 RepID=UPI001315E6F3|nr:hypothetical protein [Streptomyces sp. GS7]QHC24308.1 hypothetical protein GR130_25935 [Streptomyces sp. GS7]